MARRYKKLYDSIAASTGLPQPEPMKKLYRPYGNKRAGTLHTNAAGRKIGGHGRRERDTMIVTAERKAVALALRNRVNRVFYVQ